MILLQVIVGAFWAFLLLAALPSMRRYWKGEPPTKVEWVWRSIWPYGAAALQGWLRAQTSLFISAWIALPGYIAAVLLPTLERHQRPAVELIVTISFAVVMIMAGVAVCAALFNKPKFLVFPALRQQEGLLVGWWRRRFRSR